MGQIQCRRTIKYLFSAPLSYCSLKALDRFGWATSLMRYNWNIFSSAFHFDVSRKNNLHTKWNEFSKSKKKFCSEKNKSCLQCYYSHLLLFQFVSNWSYTETNVFSLSLSDFRTLFHNYIIYAFSDTNPCDSSPCKNGGTCIQRAGGYTCSCRFGWSGDHCTESKYISEEEFLFQCKLLNTRNDIIEPVLCWHQNNYIFNHPMNTFKMLKFLNGNKCCLFQL